MVKGVTHQQRAIVTYDQAPKISQPGESALDFPTSAVAAQRTIILRRGFAPVLAVRTDQLDALGLQLLAQGIAVVGAIGNQSPQALLGSSAPAAGHSDLCQRLGDQFHFRRRCAAATVMTRGRFVNTAGAGTAELSVSRVSTIHQSRRCGPFSRPVAQPPARHRRRAWRKASWFCPHPAPARAPQRP